ncbi:hypothetical protein GCM10007981_03350 [Thermocladium modestius]|uniref:PD-(D/E)XK endonuclease-like domain-containing protein n=1 Tax=Thermocladium modestius TaxID=62609 RepID=A0A830GUJ5_9CREN|nr:hypothetical protein [Thermocladium modestius]GGP19483.1 hypothetical protein GCM10007981_03350 [Thermocladium modestius]
MRIKWRRAAGPDPRNYVELMALLAGVDDLDEVVGRIPLGVDLAVLGGVRPDELVKSIIALKSLSKMRRPDSNKVPVAMFVRCSAMHGFMGSDRRWGSTMRDVFSQFIGSSLHDSLISEIQARLGVRESGEAVHEYRGFALMGRADLFVPEWDHVVEIKFKKLRGSGPPMEDMLQAAAYASLYGKPRAALLYVYDNDVRGFFLPSALGMEVVNAFHEYVDSMIEGRPAITLKTINCRECPVNSICPYRDDAARPVIPPVRLDEYLDPMG